MGRPLVSIVMPYRDQEAYIGQALDALAAQSYPYIELVLADDASTDGSNYAIKRALKRSGRRYARFERIKSRRGKGFATLCNDAVKLCSGVYVGIFFAQDIMHTERIARMVDALRATRGAIAFSDCIAIDDLGVCKSESILRMQDEWIYKNCLTQASLGKNPSVCVGTLLLRRSLWKSMGGLQNYRDLIDWDFFLRATLFSEPLYVPYADYAMRVSGARLRQESGNFKEKKRMLDNAYSAIQAKRYLNPMITRYREAIQEEAYALGHKEIWERAGYPGGRFFLQALWKAQS